MKSTLAKECDEAIPALRSLKENSRIAYEKAIELTGLLEEMRGQLRLINPLRDDDLAALIRKIDDRLDGSQCNIRRSELGDLHGQIAWEGKLVDKAMEILP